MSNLARQYQQQTKEQVHVSPKQAPKRKKLEFTLGEKLLFSMVIVIMSMFALQIVTTQAAIYGVNKDIQQVESSIEKTTKVNSELQIQVSELSTYERILEKAKAAGLKLEEQNVKVVE
ncbi:cell division protein [Bacillus coahuilensis m2-6]|uniref:Cell division protein FtsL n=1 Tax=Bacillus coahuilensis p1.1.43 TaxID=1150625 RepID=A0A147K9H3_9BACI|nr:cell division protein FtsL [Bacillus coahuilensis]KUP07013.1 cell division protein [Bacillus coahuilensis p1.1.43]KUP08568.1 cell division protein [Bacillus coahuilensis m2-6]